MQPNKSSREAVIIPLLFLFLFCISILPVESSKINPKMMLNNSAINVFLNGTNIAIQNITCAYPSTYYINANEPGISGITTYSLSTFIAYTNITGFSFNPEYGTDNRGLFWRSGTQGNDLTKEVYLDIKLNTSYIVDDYSNLIFHFNAIYAGVNAVSVSLYNSQTCSHYPAKTLFTNIGAPTYNVNYSAKFNATFDRIIITMPTAAIIHSFTLEYIKLENVTSMTEVANNQLPTASFNELTYPCLNASGSSVTIPGSSRLTVSDHENDTIYYASTLTAFNLSNDYHFSKTNCVGIGSLKTCYPYPNYNEMAYKFGYLTNNDTCPVNNPALPYDNTKMNFISGHDAVGDDSYLFELNGQCSGADKSLYRIFDKVAVGGNIDTEYVGFDVGEDFNYTWMSQDYSEVYLRLEFDRNATTTNVYSWHNSTRTWIMNFSQKTADFRLSVTNTANNSRAVMDITYSGDGIGLTDQASSSYVINPNSDDFRLLVHTMSPTGKVGIPYIYAILQSGSFSWTTSLSNITFNQPGNYNYVTFVSDIYHKDAGDHVTISEWYNIQSCSDILYIPPGLNQSGTTYQNATNSIHVVLYDLCGAGDDIARAFSLDTDCVNNTYWAYVIMTMLLCLGISGMLLTMLGNPFISMGFFLGSWSLLQAAVYPIFLFDIGFKIVWGLLFACGLGSLIVGLLNLN